jgi:hypothetical protein
VRLFVTRTTVEARILRKLELPKCATENRRLDAALSWFA